MTTGGPGPEVAVGAVAVHDDRLLLIRRGHAPGVGVWSLPGGRVEPGEMLSEALVREVEEETGLESVCGSLIGWVERIGDGHHFVILDFDVTVLDPSVEPCAGDDADDARWVPLSEVAELTLADGLAEFLHEHGVIETIT